MGQFQVVIVILADALKLGRVSNLPTVWTNMLAGLVLAGGLPDARIVPLLIALSLFYIGGMYLNDAFDAEIDAVERPERPIPADRVGRGTIFALGFGMLALGIVMVGAIGTIWGSGVWPLLSGAALAGAITLYNWHHKANPLSPLIMGVCRMLVYITAGLCFLPGLPPALLLGAVLLLSYLIGLTYVAKQENLKQVKNLWPMLFLLAPLIYGLAQQGAQQGEQPVALVFAVLLGLWILVALFFIKRRQPGDIPRAVVSLIAGISLVDALLIASTGATVLAMLACLGFLLTLAFQRFVPGT